MQLHNLVNSSVEARQVPLRFPEMNETENHGTPARSRLAKPHPLRTTTGTFITPQTLMAFPFAAGLVAGIWQAADVLGLGDHNYIGFLISLFVGAVVYGITVSDPRLKTKRQDRLVGLGIGLINCFYLFMAAMGLHRASHFSPH